MLLVVSSITLVTRLTGLVREMLIAYVFGAGQLTDAFYISSKIPNLVRKIFAEGALYQSFLPVYSTVKTTKRPQDAQTFARLMVTTLALGLGAVLLISLVFSSELLSIISPNLVRRNISAFMKASIMNRIMLPYIVLITFSSFATCILNVHKQFIVPAFSPTLLNVTFIIFTLFLSKHLSHPAQSLPYALIVGGLLQCTACYLNLLLTNTAPIVSFGLKDLHETNEVASVYKKMIFPFCAASIAQLVQLLNANLASRIGKGFVSCIGYSDKIMELPVSLFGAALNSILLPNLSKSSAPESCSEYYALIDWGLKMTIILSIPSAFVLLLLAEPLTIIFFSYGKFSFYMVKMISRSLMPYGLGLVGIMITKVISSGFYAKQDVKTPALISLIGLIVAQITSRFFVPLMGHTGLTFGNSIGSLVGALLSLRGLSRQDSYRTNQQWPLLTTQVLISCIPLCVLSGAAAAHFDWTSPSLSPLMRIILLALTVGSAGASYFFSLKALGLGSLEFSTNSPGS